MERENWREKLKALALQICEKNGFELFDIETIASGKRWLVRVTLDSESMPVTIDACETVSKELSLVLDAEDIVPHSYILEVSSPGVERKLKVLKDFERFKGETAFVVFSAISEEVPAGCLTGKIISIEDGNIVFEKENEVRAKIPIEKIKRANLVFKFGK